MSLAIAYAVKRRANKMAKGGEVKGVHKPSYSSGKDQGQSESGDVVRMAKHNKNFSSPTRQGLVNGAKMEHQKVLEEGRAIHPKLKGLAEGGEVDEDMVSRIMKKRCYSEGGQVANDTDMSADGMDNDFDYLAHNDELEFHETAENSGDEDNDDDIIKRIMKKRQA